MSRFFPLRIVILLYLSILSVVLSFTVGPTKVVSNKNNQQCILSTSCITLSSLELKLEPKRKRNTILFSSTQKFDGALSIEQIAILRKLLKQQQQEQQQEQQQQNNNNNTENSHSIYRKNSDNRGIKVKTNIKGRRLKKGEIRYANIRRDREGLPVDPIPAKRPFRSDIVSRYGRSIPKRANQGKALEIGMTNPSRMVIVGGIARSKRLDCPDTYLRPMMAKVREALFSSLEQYGVLRDANVLDLFAGAGSVGLEALSRGAKEATFIDYSKECGQVIGKNLKWCDFEKQGRILGSNVYDVLYDPKKYGLFESFDIITVTPPYEEVSYADLITAVIRSKVIKENSIIVIEYPHELGPLPHTLKDGNIIGLRNRRYGRTVVATYINEPNGTIKARSYPEEFAFLYTSPKLNK